MFMFQRLFSSQGVRSSIDPMKRRTVSRFDVSRCDASVSACEKQSCETAFGQFDKNGHQMIQRRQRQLPILLKSFESSFINGDMWSSSSCFRHADRQAQQTAAMTHTHTTSLGSCMLQRWCHAQHANPYLFLLYERKAIRHETYCQKTKQSQSYPFVFLFFLPARLPPRQAAPSASRRFRLRSPLQLQ